MREAYLGIDVGSISTKGVIINKDKEILASEYIWTEGDPIGAVKRLVALLEKQFDKEHNKIVATGTTGSARRLVGTITGATMVKNEITAHAVGTTAFYPEVRTILEIGGQDSKIILVENGVAVDYAMNTLCAAGTGAFLSSQSKRLGIEVEEMPSGQSIRRRLPPDVQYLRSQIWFIKFRWGIRRKILLQGSVMRLFQII